MSDKPMLSRILQLLVLGIAVGTPAPLFAQRPADFGQQWVRSHPFMINGYVNSRPPAPMLSGAGLNSIIVNAYFPSHIAHYNDAGYYPSWHGGLSATSLTPTVQNAATAMYANFPQGTSGWYVCDEPNESMFAGVADVTEWLKGQFPAMLVYSNLMGAHGYDGTPEQRVLHDAWIANYIETVQPDILMHDYYPFRAESSNMGNCWETFYDTAMGHRRMAQLYNLPKFAVLQSFEWSGSRWASDSEGRLQSFTYLTMGYQGLAYFAYAGNDADHPGLVRDSSGVKSPMYDNVATANPEVVRLGNTLRFAESTDVRFVPGHHQWLLWRLQNETPTALSDWSAGAGGDSHITGVSVEQDGERKDGLIGFFQDDNGQELFMLTNSYSGESLSAADAALPFRITFDTSIDSLLCLDRLTDQQTIVPLDNHVLNVVLPGGTGNLYKYNNGVGFMVPEPSQIVMTLGAVCIWLGWRRRRPR